MKAFGLAALALSIGALAGCAAQPLTRADVDGRIVCDADRMAQLEREARRNNTELHWVRCPAATLRTS